MKQNTSTNLISQTIGLDLGDKRSVAVVLAPSGEVLEELKFQTSRTKCPRRLLDYMPRQPRAGRVD